MEVGWPRVYLGFCCFEGRRDVDFCLDISTNSRLDIHRERLRVADGNHFGRRTEERQRVGQTVSRAEPANWQILYLGLQVDD